MDALQGASSSRPSVARGLSSEKLRAAIAEALAGPTDERALRLRVWEYVGTERDVGTGAGHVIMALTELVERAGLAPDTYHSLLRKVILWYVEAYFGHIGGDVVGREEVAFGDDPMRRSQA